MYVINTVKEEAEEFHYYFKANVVKQKDLNKIKYFKENATFSSIKPNLTTLRKFSSANAFIQSSTTSKIFSINYLIFKFAANDHTK